MAHKKLDSVQQIATGTGTSALTLGAATSAKFKTLQAAGLNDGDTIYVRIQHSTIDSEWECVKVTRSGSTIVRQFDSKSSSPTGALINFTSGDKVVSGVVLANQAVTVDDTGNTYIPGNLNVAGSVSGNTSSFVDALQNAWDNDKVLNWLGGDVTISSPIVLQATTGKYGFGLRGNGAKIISNFNNSSAYAITIEVPVSGGGVIQNVNVRNFTISDLLFSGTTPFAGAIQMKALTNGSWINSFQMINLTCETHSGYAYYWNGSIFECKGSLLKATGGLGGLKIERADYNGNNDFGLPSAMEIDYPNFRDGSQHGVYMTCRVAYTEPFDLSIRGGYIVTMGGLGVQAPAGITLVDGLGIENVNGGFGLQIGYRGGIVKGGTRGANPIANAQAGGPGMRYLIDWWAATGKLIIEDCFYENEISGSGMTLARTNGSGTVYLQRVGNSSVVDNSGCTISVGQV